ncbi:MAG: hypothetical protein IPK13_25455 [Deltaproteobacteria bacterium]|nr:hypothetical protein [Deltaproteobacteria bacterium]
MATTGALTIAVAVAMAWVVVPHRSAAASPLYRLGADALVTASNDSTGVVVLQGEAKSSRWLRAEALVWGGHRGEDEADALVMSLRLRAPRGWAEGRLGRFILSSGVGRPVHLDGIDGRVRAPWGTTVELFGGLPVVPRFEARRGDWVVGGRLSQSLFDSVQLGASALHQTDASSPARSDVGLDLTIVPTEYIDVVARTTYDLLSNGLSEALVQAGVGLGPMRAELFGRHQTPARLLPATSIFSVIGDVPSRLGGLRLSWKVAPRLDVWVTLGVRERDRVGEELSAKTTLRLDDRGEGALSLEVVRSGMPDNEWTGVRGLARIPLFDSWIARLELELARRDDEKGRGRTWPWGIASLAWQPGPWSFGAALEAGATPAYEYAVDGLFRMSYRWSAE